MQYFYVVFIFISFHLWHVSYLCFIVKLNCSIFSWNIFRIYPFVWLNHTEFFNCYLFSEITGQELFFILGYHMGDIPQGRPSPARGWWEQGEANWRHLLLGFRLPQGRPGHVVRANSRGQLSWHQGEYWRLISVEIYAFLSSFQGFRGCTLHLKIEISVNLCIF